MAIRKIIVGIDGSESSHEALMWALVEAGLRDTPCVALHAYDVESRAEDSFVPSVEMGRATETARAMLAEALKRVPVELREGAIVEERTDFAPAASALIAASRDALMLVVGSRGRSELKSVVLGSVSESCVHHAHCPVLVVRHQQGRLADGDADGVSDERVGG